MTSATRTGVCRTLKSPQQLPASRNRANHMHLSRFTPAPSLKITAGRNALDAQLVQYLFVLCRNRVVSHVLEKSRVIPDLEVRQLPLDVHLTFHLRRVP